MPAYLDDNGTWYALFYYENFKKEKKRKKKRGFGTEQEANDFEEDFKAKASLARYLPFRDFAEIYLENIGPRIRISTYDTKIRSLNKWVVPFFEGKPLNEITSIDIIHWQGWLSEARKKDGEPLAPTYVRKLNSDLAAIFNHAAKNYDLDPNPVKKVKKTGKQKADEMKIWSKEEFELFIDAICDKVVSYYAFEILYWTGIREGELLALTPADFDFEECYLDISKSVYRRGSEDIVGPPKTEKSYRRFRIPRFLAEEVEEYIRLFLHIADDERIFEGLTKSYLCKEMERGCKIAGIKRIRVHDLRHSYVSILIDMGYSAIDIANRVGHESIDITYRYAHLFPNSQQGMATRLQDVGSQRRCVQKIDGCPI